MPEERIGIAGDQLDEVRLPPGPGLFEEAAEMGPDGRLGDAEHGRYVGHIAADFDDGNQNPKLGGGKFELLG